MMSLEVWEQSHHFLHRLNLCSLVHLALENASIMSLLNTIQGWVVCHSERLVGGDVKVCQKLGREPGRLPAGNDWNPLFQAAFPLQPGIPGEGSLLCGHLRCRALRVCTEGGRSALPGHGSEQESAVHCHLSGENTLEVPWAAQCSLPAQTPRRVLSPLLLLLPWTSPGRLQRLQCCVRAEGVEGVTLLSAYIP